MGTKGREDLEKILNKQEYQVYYEDHRSLWQKLLAWFMEMIEKLFMKLFPALGSTTNIAGIVVTVLVIIIVIILMLVMFNLWRKRKIQRAYEQTIPLSSLHEMEWTYEDHFSKAKDRELEGDYKQSIRHLFLGLLLFYDHIDWLKAEAWKTNWEYYRELERKTREGADSFNKLAPTFDAVTYGRKEVNEKQFNEFKQYVEKAYHFAKGRLIKEGE